jgi:hypothetical protein
MPAQESRNRSQVKQPAPSGNASEAMAHGSALPRMALTSASPRPVSAAIVRRSMARADNVLTAGALS